MPAHGCLVIADIGGYTRYLSGVELEHSADVLADLLQTVVNALEPNFPVAKVEGDAIFVYDAGEADGSVLVEHVFHAVIAAWTLHAHCLPSGPNSCGLLVLQLVISSSLP